MELATVTAEDRQTARRRFLEYRAAVRERHDEEDTQIMRGYRALALGHTLISLSSTIDAGGLDDAGLPRLAVAPALAEWCYLRVERSAWHDDAAEHGWNVNYLGHDNAVRGKNTRSSRLVPGIFRDQQMSNRTWGLRAMVPPVPPGLRPARGLRSYWTLFEVPRWERAPRPPGDPALLRPIGGDLYAVVATWDLTELELLVLAGRRG